MPNLLGASVVKLKQNEVRKISLALNPENHSSENSADNNNVSFLDLFTLFTKYSLLWGNNQNSSQSINTLNKLKKLAEDSKKKSCPKYTLSGNFRIYFTNNSVIESFCLEPAYLTIQKFKIKRNDNGVLTSLKYSQIRKIVILDNSNTQKDNVFQNYQEGSRSTRAIVTAITDYGNEVILEGTIRSDAAWYFYDEFGSRNPFYLGDINSRNKTNKGPFLNRIEFIW